VQFGESGRVSGRASCNTYTGQYALSGEGVAIRDPAVTVRACAASLMAQEERFLATLRAVHGFDFTSDGALVLRADGKRSIKARRGG
jgi:heat shock protein HslJ